ncbi:hypothetical protein LIA77_05428 [Sarocladium implicatum]|nr:hypothetical protein LIA77_05428 [Sarocladium implicatum]
MCSMGRLSAMIPGDPPSETDGTVYVRTVGCQPNPIVIVQWWATALMIGSWSSMLCSLQA